MRTSLLTNTRNIGFCFKGFLILQLDKYYFLIVWYLYFTEKKCKKKENCISSMFK